MKVKASKYIAVTPSLNWLVLCTRRYRLTIFPTPCFRVCLCTLLYLPCSSTSLWPVRQLVARSSLIPASVGLHPLYRVRRVCVLRGADRGPLVFPVFSALS